MKKGLLLILTTISFFLKAQEWKFLTPVKSYSKITNLEVTPDQTIYLLDTSYPSGIVASSNDNGITWKKLFRNGGYRDIQMLSNTDGYLLKDTGIIKTYDAFQTSTYKAIAATSTALYFLDTTKGFVCGTGGNIFKTTDSANNFTNISLNTSVNLNDVYFINDNIGFVCGVNGSVYKTTDQGATWTAQNLSSTSLNKILFVTTDIGFVAGNNGKIFKTIDQGNTWVSLTSNTLYNLNDIKYNNNILYAAGQASRIVKSNDMGNTWTEQVISVYPFPELFTVSFVNSNILAGAEANIFGSTNSTTWNTFIKGIYASKLVDISFSNNNQGVVVGNKDGNSVIYQTTNGGNTWINKKVSFTEYLYNAVDMKPTGKGLVVGSGQYLTTSDFGSTWNGPYNTTPSTALSECWLKNNNDYIIGTNPGSPVNDGLILKNASGWSQFNTITGIVKIEFYDDLLGFAGSQYGELYKTTDGGMSWTALTSYNNNNVISKIDIINPTTVYVNEYLSTDGGITFNPATNASSNSDFFSDLNGLAFGFGDVYRTTDGGVNWNLIVSSSYYFNSFLYNINKIKYFPNKIIAIGDLSDIYMLELGSFSLATNDIKKENKIIQVYPNPTSSLLTFSKPVNLDNVKIYDVAGRLQNFKKAANGINIYHLNSGIYFIKFNLNGEWITEKIIKE